MILRSMYLLYVLILALWLRGLHVGSMALDCSFGREFPETALLAAYIYILPRGA